MKTLLRIFIVTIISLWVVDYWLPEGLRIDGGWSTLAKTSGWLTAANLFVRPLVNLVLLPLNLLTMGSFKWITQVLILWGVTYLNPDVHISTFKLAGQFLGFGLPQITLEGVFAYVAIGFLLTFISNLILWLFE